MHGTEPGGRQLLLTLAEWLCASYSKDAAAQRIVNGMHLFLCVACVLLLPGTIVWLQAAVVVWSCVLCSQRCGAMQTLGCWPQGSPPSIASRLPSRHATHPNPSLLRARPSAACPL